MGKEIDQKTRFDNAKWLYSSLEGNIRAADTKAAWIFSVLSVITGAMLTIVSKLDLNMFNMDRTMLLLMGGGALTIFSFKTFFQ